MTLAVARRVGKSVTLAADWRLRPPKGFEHRVPRDQDGALKVVILHPHLAVAYAGGHISALDALRAFADLGPLQDVDDIVPDMVEHLQDVSGRATDDRADFLLGLAGESPRIARIRDGEVLWPTDGAQIGDSEAVEAFLAAEHVDPVRDRLFGEGFEPEARDELKARYAKTVVSRIIETGVGGPTIGGPVVEASIRDGRFRYGGVIGKMSTQPQIIVGDPEKVPEAERKNAEMRRIDGGSVDWEICAPKQAGVGALGLYFTQPRLGIFAYPMRHDELVTYSKVQRQEFATRVAAEYQIELDVLGADRSDSVD